MLPYGPHWFTWVMGTGIVAVALAGLPVDLPGAHTVALAFWLLAAALLAGVTAATVHHWRTDRGLAVRHLDDPALAHFYGAPAMALLTVGAGAVLVGHEVIGPHVALVVDAVLWTAGTLVGLVTAVLVPYRAITVHATRDDSANATWLMPVVPPMVSAATGPLLIPHLPAGEAQATLLLLCYACFGISLLAGLLVTTAVWQRLVRHGVGDAATTPTVWIVLGFLGQSVTAVHQLGEVAPVIWPKTGRAFTVLALVYGIPVWGFAMLWLALASALVLRTVRAGMPFAPTWWSFTFPLGTVVTGTSALAVTTGLVLLQAVAVGLMLLLVGLWSVVAVRTAVRLRPVLASAPTGWKTGEAPLRPGV